MTIPCSSQILRTPSHELTRRDDEAALALDGLDHDRGDRLGGDLRHERALERGERRLPVGPAVVVRERHAVDLGRKRPEAGLVRVRLRGQREAEQRPPVEAALEADHCRPAGVRAGELDRVLDRLGARVEERRLCVRDRRQLAEPLREPDVGLVRDDREIRVAEPLELLLRRLDDPRVRVADVQAADAAGEVDEGVPVDVGERRALPALDHDGDVDGEGVGDHALLALEDLAGAGAGDVGAQLDGLGRRHERDDSGAIGRCE